jgi:formate C-acetyltransferase
VNVPANPPKTLQEALQSIWTVESLLKSKRTRLACRWAVLTSITTRCSEADIREGRLTHEAALEPISGFHYRR